MKVVKNKLVLTVLFMLIFFISIKSVTTVSASENIGDSEKLSDFTQILETLLSGLNLSNLENFFNEYANELSSQTTLLQEIEKALNGEYLFDFSKIFSVILKIIMKNIKSFLPLILSVLSIVIITGVFDKIGPLKTKLSDVVFAFSYGVISIIIFSNGANLLKEIKGVLNGITVQTESVFPLLLTLVSVSGGSTSAKVLNPVCVFVNNGVMQIIIKILFPLISVIMVLNVIANLSEKFSLNKIKEFFTGCFKWIVGITVLIFSFFLGINSFGASTFDGISLRTIKYAVGNSIPIIGNFTKDGIDIVIMASVLIKNSIGNIVITLIFCGVFFPLISVICHSLVIKLIAGLVEPLADKRICELINNFSKSITLISIILIMVFVVYFVTIFMIICAQSAIFT